MIKLDEKTALKRVYDPYTEDIQHKELSAEFIKLKEYIQKSAYITRQQMKKNNLKSN